MSQYSTPLTTRGDLLYRDASGDQRLAKGTDGQFLKIGANDPEWAADNAVPPDDSVSAAKLDLSIVQGDLVYGTGADAWTRLAKSTAGKVLTMNSGATAPEWADAAGGGAVGGGSDKIFMEKR